MSFQVHAALTTPVTTESGSLDLDALRLHVELLAEDGVDGVVPGGHDGGGAAARGVGGGDGDRHGDADRGRAAWR